MSHSRIPSLRLALIALVVPGALWAQQPPSGGPPSQGGPGGPGADRPRAMKLPKLRVGDVEKAARTMFAEGDLDRDGTITLEEVQTMVDRHRDAAISARFESLDGDGNQVIDYTEFMTWQLSLGARAAEDGGSRAFEMSRLPDAVEVPSGRGDKDRFLTMLLTPVSRASVIEANVDYDAGADLAEFVAFQRRRFDVADEDGNGTLEDGELRRLMEMGRGQESCIVATLSPPPGDDRPGSSPPGQGPRACGPPPR